MVTRKFASGVGPALAGSVSLLLGVPLSYAQDSRNGSLANPYESYYSPLSMVRLTFPSQQIQRPKILGKTAEKSRPIREQSPMSML